MENRGKLLFEGDAQSSWYLASADQWIGPLTTAEVYKKIQNHEATWAHYLWKPGQTEWKRVCEIKVFEATAPKPPNREVQSHIKTLAEASQLIRQSPPPPPRPKSLPQKIWYLHEGEAQFGPFSTEEVTHLLKVGKVGPRVYAWRDGMAGWEVLSKIQEFSAVMASAGVASRARSEKRNAPRRPLVARIFLSHQDSVIVAVCRDISVGGMQVLTDRIPGAAGTRLKMNVSPAGTDHPEPLQPFLAEGVIVRVLEDRCGFSFRFDKLPERARRAIETYIEAGH